MDFTTIGTLHSYVQQKNLKFAANYKQKTGQTIVSSSGNLKLDLKAANNQSLAEKMIQANQKSDNEYSKQRISSIKRKLMSGKKISNEELGYLKKNDPDLYKKAKKAEEAREDLKAELRKAKTKAEARMAVTRALIKASAEATAELKAAQGGAGGGSGFTSGEGGVSTAGYEAGQEIGGPTAEGIFGGGVNSSGEEPSMIRLNEQINASSVEGESNVDIEAAATQEGAALKEINNDVSVAREVEIEAAKAESANSEESINNKAEHSDSTNSTKSTDWKTDNNGDPTSGILEKFIMVVRAIEDEWATFAKSDEYKEMPEDLFEEAENEMSGKHKRKKQESINEPNYQILDAISAYRSAMMFDNDDDNDFDK
ncbi:MAG: hypothetical protein IJ862_00445 [Selenomonadaceae bacterium]|nr:hypothetical protein [Selenomonadaceae bacterium]